MNVFFTIISFISFVFAFVCIKVFKNGDCEKLPCACIVIYFIVVALENAFLIGW